MNCSLPGFSVHGINQQEYWNIFDPGIEPTSPALACRFFTAEPPGKPICVSVCVCVCVIVCVLCSVTSVMSDFLQLHGLPPPRLLDPWDSPGKNTGVGCHFLLIRLYMYIYIYIYIYITPNFIRATLLNHPLAYFSLSWCM